MIAADAVAVTPSDSTELFGVIGLYVGGTGDVHVETIAGNVAVFLGVPAGKDIPLQIQKVLAATSATDIVAYVK
jgi:hypothetical protein